MTDPLPLPISVPFFFIGGEGCGRPDKYGMYARISHVYDRNQATACDVFGRNHNHDHEDQNRTLSLTTDHFPTYQYTNHNYAHAFP